MDLSIAALKEYVRKATVSKNKIVGVDMGASSIKVVGLEDKAGVMTVSTYGEVQLGPYAAASAGEVVDVSFQNRNSAFLDVLSHAGVYRGQVVMAVPLASSFVITTSLTAAPDEDLGPRIPVEARKYIPVPMADVTLDWAEISAADHSDTESREVILAAIQNDSLKHIKQHVLAGNFAKHHNEIECFSTIRAITTDPTKHTAVIDFGAQSTKLYLAHQGVLQRIHRVGIGSAFFTKRLAQMIDVSFLEAEHIKRQGGAAEAYVSDIKKAAYACYERPLQEFSRVLHQYESESKIEIEEIHLCGGGSQYSELPDLVTQSIGRAAHVFNPFERVAYPAVLESLLQEIGPSFTTALGAALFSED